MQQRFNRKKVVDFLHILWQKFSSSERKQVWNNMSQVEREFWYSAREAPFLRKEVLIDTAENLTEEKKRRAVLTHMDKTFFDGTFMQIVEKIERTYPIIISKKKFYSCL